jgi:ribonuclease HII
VLNDYDPRQGAPDLWRILNRAVCRRPRDRRHRIAIEDSKKLKGANSGAVHPLRALERGVLSLRLTQGESSATDDALFDRLELEPPTVPWYGSSTTLPVAVDADELRIAAARLRRVMDTAGVACSLMRCEVIGAGDFNRQVASMRTKASVNICGVMRLIDEVWRSYKDDHPRVIVDRQGGRTKYLRILQLSFEGAQVRIVAEDEGQSRYHLVRDGSEMTLSFVRAAESQHLPVALASMIAKYVRELLMLRLNRFFQQQLPELRATAGYVKDARRYLVEIEPVIQRLGLERTALVRSV